MDIEFKPVWLLIGVPIIGLAIYALFGYESDHAKFERLQVGMSTAEVRDIVYPPIGGRNAGRRQFVRDNEVLQLNDAMILTMVDGRLVNKEWIGPDPAEGTAQARQ